MAASPTADAPEVATDPVEDLVLAGCVAMRDEFFCIGALATGSSKFEENSSEPEEVVVVVVTVVNAGWSEGTVVGDCGVEVVAAELFDIVVVSLVSTSVSSLVDKDCIDLELENCPRLRTPVDGDFMSCFMASNCCC